MSTNTSGNLPNRTPARLGEIVVLNRDLFFGVKIGNQLRALGYDVTFLEVAASFADAARAGDAVLGIIDLNVAPDWDEIARLAAERGERTSLLVFGSHLDVEGLRAAKAAGVRRVVSNGEFHKNMAALVQRYARRLDE